MDKKLKAISKVSVAFALLGAAAPAAGTAPTALAAKKATKKNTKKKAKKAKKKSVKKTNAQKYTPKAKSVTVKAGSKLAAKSVITNASKLPAKTKYVFSPKPNLKKTGTYIVSVIVTYPDKSKDKVKNVKIKVTAKKAAYNPAKAAYEKYKKQAAELGSLEAAQNDLSQKKAALDSANQAYKDAETSVVS